jgi:hypothetical protein
MTFPVLSASTPLASYNLTRSLRFRSSASANLSKTFAASPAVQTKQTLSVWCKRGTLSTEQRLMAGYDGVQANGTRLVFQSGNAIEFRFNLSSVLITTAVYRDPSAWYHVLVSIDTTQATAANRLSLYVNGVKVTAFGTATYPTQNDVSQFVLNNGNNKIGSQDNNTFYFDGYMAEFNFIDGQALTPSSFGSTNATTGVWQPAKYTGTYGTNGFYLPFTDNSALTTASNAGLGKDFSGNANYWVTNNISITAGATYDSMTDVPTLTSSTAANFCVGSPLNYRTTTPTPTITDGNLSWIGPSASLSSIGCATFGGASGKFYWEATRVGTNTGFIGVVNGQFNAATSNIYDLGYNSNEYAYTSGSGKVNNNSSVAYGASFTSGDVIGVALDLDAGTLTFYKNNTSQGVAYSSLPLGNYWLPAFDSYNGAGFTLNFGQRPFSYTPPSGFVALNTYNLPASTVPNGAAFMAATLYTGTGSSLTVANTVGSASFQPDWVWIKSRSAATDHKLTDVVRGVTKGLISDTTGAETTDTNGLTAFGSTGFTVGTDTNYNNSAATYVAWQWKAGGTAVSNTSGSITSSVSANTTSGCSVVTYTGTGVAATVGHGLGVAPSMITVKSRSAAGAWPVYHSTLGNGSNLVLNTTAATATSATIWNATSPTSSVFSVGINTDSNTVTVTYVAYCFAAIKGFSAFGSYTGNGSDDGTFVYTGFRPRWIMMKRYNVIGDWFMVNTSTGTTNIVGPVLFANVSDAESTSSFIDILSNGFKLRNSGSGANVSTGTYIYAAFAENPFQNALAR